MGFDFSAVDADLAALGSAPDQAPELAREIADSLATLDAVDAALAALGEPVDLGRFAESARVPERAHPSLAVLDGESEHLELDSEEPVHAPEDFTGEFMVAGNRPKSGEMVLPEPVQRPSSVSPSSGELSLGDSTRPRSGSFELPDSEESTEPTLESETSDAPFEPNLLGDASLEPGFESGPPPAAKQLNARESDLADASEEPEFQIDTLDSDDPDTQDVFAMFDGQSEEPSPRSLKGLADLPSSRLDDGGKMTLQDRDPDAEFEAIFSDATSPAGIPTRTFAEEEELSAEDLLSGLTSPSGPLGESALAGGGESELYSEREDATDIIDSGTLDSIKSGAPPSDDNPFRNEEELGSSEFEILLDDAEPVTSKSAMKSPPPPLPRPSQPTGPIDKRPSFLGRLFGRKDEP